MWKKLYGKIRRPVRYVVGLKVPVYASHAGFFLVLSSFPLLVLLLSLLRYTGLTVDNLTDQLVGIVPNALLPAAKKLIVSTYRSTGGTVISLSAVTALWSGSRGIYGLMAGLNHIYGLRETRGYFHTRGLSVLYTFLFLLVLLVNILLGVFGNALLRWLPQDMLAGAKSVVNFRFFVLLFTQSALFTAIYTVLPNRKSALKEAIPGALLASAGWLLFSALYSVYVTRFAGLSKVYGSVYAVALSLLWLYCCVSIVFYGGALNRWLAKENMDKM